MESPTSEGGARAVWLSDAPKVADRSEARRVVGAVAARIAAALQRPMPVALDAGTHPWAAAAPAEIVDIDLLGQSWEALLTSDDRRRTGAHYTSRAVAELVTALAFERLDRGDTCPRVWDPAVGGGAFLLAAARELERAGSWDRPTIASHLVGTDVDSGAAAVANATMALWAGEDRAQVEVADPLVGGGTRVESGFDAVVGNPPFLGQLTVDTARSSGRRAQLRRRFGDAATGYVDESLLFLLESIRSLREGGVVALVLPESILGAADASSARVAAMAEASIAAMWVGDASSFSAAVEVIAPVLVRGAVPGPVEVVDSTGRRSSAPHPQRGVWSGLLGAAIGVPSVALPRGRSLSDVASVTAGFRQHFYGVTGAVVEEREASGPPDDRVRLVTAGLIEPLQPGWGRRAMRFAGEDWQRPILELHSIADPSVRDWFHRRRRPKVLVATQTPVVEAIVDPDGSLAPSVPVISVEPERVSDIWRIAAWLSAPPVTAYIAADNAGTGLSRNSVRIRASALAALPEPVEDDSWTEGAQLAEQAQQAAIDGRWDRHRTAVLDMGRAMTAAFAADRSVWEWWRGRLRFPAC